jgi:hypothetical protein
MKQFSISALVPFAKYLTSKYSNPLLIIFASISSIAPSSSIYSSVIRESNGSGCKDGYHSFLPLCSVLRKLMMSFNPLQISSSSSSPMPPAVLNEMQITFPY